MQRVKIQCCDWNGIDYSDFTDLHKQMIRLHYAALVHQLDNEVGQILAALNAQNLLDKMELFL